MLWEELSKDYQTRSNLRNGNIWRKEPKILGRVYKYNFSEKTINSK